MEVVIIRFKCVRALGEGRKTADRTDHQPAAGDGARQLRVWGRRCPREHFRLLLSGQSYEIEGWLLNWCLVCSVNVECVTYLPLYLPSGEKKGLFIEGWRVLLQNPAKVVVVVVVLAEPRGRQAMRLWFLYQVLPQVWSNCRLTRSSESLPKASRGSQSAPCTLLAVEILGVATELISVTYLELGPILHFKEMQGVSVDYFLLFDMNSHSLSLSSRLAKNI